MEKRSKETLDLEQMDAMLRQRMKEEADRYEKEMNSDPSLDGIEPSARVFENIMAAIEEEEAKEADDRRPEDFLSEADRRALELGRKQMAHPVRRRILRLAGIAAAVMVGVFGASMTIEANREKLMNVINVLVAKESVAQLDNDDTNTLVKVDEREARAEIAEKLGISPIEFMYMPPGMEYDGYVVNENSGSARMFYKYQNTILYLTMDIGSDGMSDGATRDGETVDVFNQESEYGTIQITEIQGPGEIDYLAELQYNNCYYAVYGILSKEEFLKMIEKIEIF